MSPLLLLGVTGIAGVMANRTVKKSKNLPVSLTGGVLSFFFPLVTLGVNALRKARPPRGRDEREQALFDRRFSVDEHKKRIERTLSRSERLGVMRDRALERRERMEDGRNRGVVRAGMAVTGAAAGVLGFLRNRVDRRVDRQQDDLRVQYEMLARTQRIAEESKGERFAGIIMRHDSPDGRPRFIFPYDMSREQRFEATVLLANMFGIGPEDKGRFSVGTHRGMETTLYRKDQSMMIFDSKERRVTPLGAEMPEDVMDSVLKVQKRLKGWSDAVILKDHPAYGAPEGLLTMTPVGKEAVALNMNGVTLAFAVAGPDGKVRTMGHAVSSEDRNGMRLASQLNERLKGCVNMSEWVDVAARIVLSDENLQNGIRQRDRRRSVKREVRQRMDMRESILNAPARSLKKLSGGIKMS